jgi:hypothetical protein
MSLSSIASRPVHWRLRQIGLAVLCAVAAAPLSAATIDFSYVLRGVESTLSGAGSFSTSSNLDDVYSVGNGIDDLTFSTPTITGVPFSPHFADLARTALNRGALNVTLSGGALSNVTFHAAGSGIAGSGLFGADYDFSFAINGLGAGNASAHGAVKDHLGIINFSDDLTGTAVFNNVTPQDNGFAIPDGQSMASLFQVGEHGVVDGLSIEMFDLEHSFSGDLTFKLSHLGRSVVFADPWGDRKSPTGTATDFNGDYVLEDGLTPTLFDALSGVPTLPSGAYGTSGDPFSKFNGMDRAGEWILTIMDNSLKDEGSLGRWSLRFGGANRPVGEVPEPGAWAMMIVGLGAIGFRLRARQDGMKVLPADQG